MLSDLRKSASASPRLWVISGMPFTVCARPSNSLAAFDALRCMAIWTSFSNAFRSEKISFRIAEIVGDQRNAVHGLRQTKQFACGVRRVALHGDLDFLLQCFLVREQALDFFLQLVDR